VRNDEQFQAVNLDSTGLTAALRDCQPSSIQGSDDDFCPYSRYLWAVFSANWDSRIHSVLRAIGTRYVGKSSKNRKIDAALHNFNGLAKCCGQKQFFKKVAADID
jgi:hypothetical protein